MGSSYVSTAVVLELWILLAGTILAQPGQANNLEDLVLRHKHLLVNKVHCIPHDDLPIQACRGKVASRAFALVLKDMQINNAVGVRHLVVASIDVKLRASPGHLPNIRANQLVSVA